MKKTCAWDIQAMEGVSTKVAELLTECLDLLEE